MNSTEPELMASRREGADKARLSLRLPTDLIYFKGHFPQFPILPGVVQLDWAIRQAPLLFPLQGAFRAVEALKFQKVLQPGDEADLELDYKPEKNSVFFRYVSARGRHASGTLVFG
jgi:3-hydroxymyristoyl/3-hydroxydecanoyl-(acyl carrier protein) dehydratase